MKPKMSETKVTLKLQIDKKNNKVLYAEADKDCVDFLLHVFLLPVGTAMSHLVNDETPTLNTFPLANLYNSLRNKEFTSKYMASSSSSFLNPTVTSRAATRRVPLWSENYLPKPDHRGDHLSDMSRWMRDLEVGYVRGVVTYMITDGLDVKPLSSKSTIELLSALSLKDFGSIEESVVTLDTQQGMALLNVEGVIDIEHCSH